MPPKRKVGPFCKGVVILQRCPKNANGFRSRKVRSERKERFSMSFFSYSKLMEVVKDRGYMTNRAVAARLAPIFGVTPERVTYKLKYDKLSAGDCEVIGAVFEMTMREYYDVFLNGLFRENEEGHWVAHIESPYLHLHPPKEQRKSTRTKKKPMEKRNRIMDDIESVTQTTE